jgi:hypothetical protein
MPVTDETSVALFGITGWKIWFSTLFDKGLVVSIGI